MYMYIYIYKRLNEIEIAANGNQGAHILSSLCIFPFLWEISTSPLSSSIIYVVTLYLHPRIIRQKREYVGNKDDIAQLNRKRGQEKEKLGHKNDRGLRCLANGALERQNSGREKEGVVS